MLIYVLVDQVMVVWNANKMFVTELYSTILLFVMEEELVILQTNVLVNQVTQVMTVRMLFAITLNPIILKFAQVMVFVQNQTSVVVLTAMLVKPVNTQFVINCGLMILRRYAVDSESALNLTPANVNMDILE
jgi:hypothetical protein